MTFVIAIILLVIAGELFCIGDFLAEIRDALETKEGEGNERTEPTA